jgi:hypothetical protein
LGKAVPTELAAVGFQTAHRRKIPAGMRKIAEKTPEKGEMATEAARYIDDRQSQ